jgi:hypothetical protein
MSLRSAINAKCRDCICDPLDAGTAAQQIACCVSTDCALHRVRPITATVIPSRLLDCYHVAPAQLDSRARALVRYEAQMSVEGQNGQILSTKGQSGGVA